MVKLQEWKDVKVGKFSRGMKQRLALAQAFLHDPPVLVLDEPTLGLDPRGVVEVREILRAERGRKTILFATHQLPQAAQVCEKIAIIEGGKLRAYQGLGELKRRFGSLEKAYLKLTGATV
jgi:ABC-2 type transport system ATP-binding protein